MVFEDTAALLGLVVALVGIHLANALHMPVLDGIASILIGLILCTVAAFLLLIGEAAAPAIQSDIRRLATQDPDVEAVGRLLTMHMGPHSLLLNMDLTFRDDLGAEGIEAAIDRLERNIRSDQPTMKYIFLEAESLTQTHRQRLLDEEDQEKIILWTEFATEKT